MKRNTLLISFAAIAVILLAAGIFTKDWIYYLLIACLVFAISILGSRKKGKPMMYGALVALLVNAIALVYLWFVNNTGNNIAASVLWCIVNVIWLIAEIICTKKAEYPIYKNWRVWICSLFLLLALFTLAVYLFTASMP